MNTTNPPLKAQSVEADVQTATARGPYSVWALAALLTSIAIPCPVATLIGPLLALRALVSIKANPQLKGKNMAIIAMLIGVLASSIWIIGGLYGATWWNREVRRPMLQGPFTSLTFNDPASFNQKFLADSNAVGGTDADHFLEQLRSSLGSFRGTIVNPDYLPPKSPAGEFPVSYILHGSNGDIPATAYFVVFAGGQAPLIAKFRWVYVLDPQAGALYFPADRRDEIIAFINQPVEAAKNPASSSPSTTP